MNYYLPSSQKRFFAALIDLFLYFLILFLFNLVLVFIYGAESLIITVLSYIETGSPSVLFIEYFVITTIVNTFLGIIYYGVIPYYSNGQTVAKYFYKLVAVNKSLLNPSFVQHCLRATFIWYSYLNFILLPLAFFNFSLFTDLTSGFLIVNGALIIVSFFRIFNRSDARTIHDLVTHTRVLTTVQKPQVEDWAT